MMSWEPDAPEYEYQYQYHASTHAMCVGATWARTYLTYFSELSRDDSDFIKHQNVECRCFYCMYRIALPSTCQGGGRLLV